MFEPIFDPFLSAYRKRYSCETALTPLVEDRREVFDTGNTTYILSTDMSQALDSTHHTVLVIPKLKAYGFSNSSANLMRSRDPIRTMRQYFPRRENSTGIGQIRVVILDGNERRKHDYNIMLHLFNSLRVSTLQHCTNLGHYAHGNNRQCMLLLVLICT